MLRTSQMIEPIRAASSSRIRMIPNGDVRNAVSAPDLHEGTVVATAGVAVAVAVGVGVGEGVGDGVAVGEGSGGWTSSVAQRGCGCCWTQIMCAPGATPFRLTVVLKLPEPSATAGASVWSALSRKTTIGSPGLNPLPVTLIVDPLGADATLRFTLPCGVGVGGAVAVGVPVGVGVPEGVGVGVAAMVASQTSGRAATSFLIFGRHCTRRRRAPDGQVRP